MTTQLEKILNLTLAWVLTDGVKLVIGLIVLSIGWKLIKKLIKIMNVLMDKNNVDKTLRNFLDALVEVVLRVVLIMAVLEFVGIKATGIAAIFASAGLAIGLALQGSLSNFAGGVIILLIRPFNVGDYIEGAGHSGTVEKISIFYTCLVTPDNKQILIPNGSLANDSIVNYSSKDTRRVDIVFGVSYDDDIFKVKRILTQVVDANELILKNPEPFISINEHGASSINFVVRAWCKTSDYWTVYFDLLEKVMVRFNEENISIPYPQMDLHLKDGKLQEN
ncbi:mechanosensitive ion channel [Clostridium sp. NSJ-6]|uniref:Mechanosensitive ion channel n=1 Tax=Clostridium hominis TaxID=2763036 RepID=A0ABR7DFB2_9CLOT|nr:mechanosensitive ion channel domain-containing protein [Clostridium hominis]MBC5630099.1 mechanosensitive ion channel [Clostridium hominis]MDU2672187.1 mechanosensitive ion channel [Clostridium sp.]